MENSTAFIFIAEDDMEGQRLDSLLSDLIPEISRSRIQRLIEEGKVSLNGVIILKKNTRVFEGDKIEAMISPLEEPSPEPEDLPLNVVYEDKDIIIINKEKGMVVHPGPGNYKGTLVNALLYHYKDQLSTVNGIQRPGIVHRLDKDTSGLLVCAKNNDAHEFLNKEFAARRVKKVYETICLDNFKEDRGVISEGIKRDDKSRLKMTVSPEGREAVTEYEVLKRFLKYTYLKATLITGRTHQIRVHMAYIKHPVLGDQLYGPKKDSVNVKGQVLHSKILGFIHPATGEYLEVDSSLPDEFLKVLKKLENIFPT